MTREQLEQFRQWLLWELEYDDAYRHRRNVRHSYLGDTVAADEQERAEEEFEKLCKMFGCQKTSD